MPNPALFTGVTVITIPPHPLLGGRGKLYCVVRMSPSECSVTEDMESITSTQYVMSGSMLVKSRVNGAIQVR